MLLLGGSQILCTNEGHMSTRMPQFFFFFFFIRNKFIVKDKYILVQKSNLTTIQNGSSNFHGPFSFLLTTTRKMTFIGNNFSRILNLVTKTLFLMTKIYCYH